MLVIKKFKGRLYRLLGAMGFAYTGRGFIKKATRNRPQVELGVMFSRDGYVFSMSPMSEPMLCIRYQPDPAAVGVLDVQEYAEMLRTNLLRMMGMVCDLYAITRCRAKVTPMVVPPNRGAAVIVFKKIEGMPVSIAGTFQTGIGPGGFQTDCGLTPSSRGDAWDEDDEDGDEDPADFRSFCVIPPATAGIPSQDGIDSLPQPFTIGVPMLPEGQAQTSSPVGMPAVAPQSSPGKECNQATAKLCLDVSKLTRGQRSMVARWLPVPFDVAELPRQPDIG